MVSILSRRFLHPSSVTSVPSSLIHFHVSNFRTYSVKDDRVPGPYLLVAPVDNFTGTPVYYDIDGFDEDGKPYKNTK